MVLVELPKAGLDLWFRKEKYVSRNLMGHISNVHLPFFLASYGFYVEMPYVSLCNVNYLLVWFSNIFPFISLSCNITNHVMMLYFVHHLLLLNYTYLSLTIKKKKKLKTENKKEKK